MHKLLEKYGIVINNKELLMAALTHSSYSNEHEAENYERLEFLGDSVLQLSISDYLYKNTELDEGEMSKLRASFVCEQALAFYSKKLKIDKELRVGHGQSKNINDAIIADAFESVLGAIYLEHDFNKTKKFIQDFIVPYIEKDFHFFGDYKSMLQEIVQTTNKSVEYVVVKEIGPAHKKKFKVEVKIGGLTYGTGIGKNKKQAEQYAALDAINKQANM